MSRRWAVIALIAAALPGCSEEQDRQKTAARDADPVAGRAVVVGGESSDVTPCFTCHGLDGGGDGSGAFPRLTGQMAFYLYKQLLDYAAGARPNAVMAPIARAMSGQQMADVALYYSGVGAPAPSPPEAPRALLERGRRIAHDGVPEAGLQACIYCHGAEGQGMPPYFPYLAGQHAIYTELQLRLWKQGVRNNDPLDVMEQIARAMSDEDIRAVALYFESVPAPAGAAGTIVVPAGRPVE